MQAEEPNWGTSARGLRCWKLCAAGMEQRNTVAEYEESETRLEVLEFPSLRRVRQGLRVLESNFVLQVWNNGTLLPSMRRVRQLMNGLVSVVHESKSDFADLKRRIHKIANTLSDVAILKVTTEDQMTFVIHLKKNVVWNGKIYFNDDVGVELRLKIRGMAMAMRLRS